MPFRIVYSDITELKVDAIVNSTNRYYSGGGTGVDSLVHLKCGKALVEATDRLPPLRLGEAKATPGFVLPCRYIIHTSGPRWRESHFLEISILGSCYRNSIQLAHSLGCRSIAFPLISSHSKHFPGQIALATAIDAIKEALREYPDMEVMLAILGRWADRIPAGFFDRLSAYVNETYEPGPPEAMAMASESAQIPVVKDSYIPEYRLGTSEKKLRTARKESARKTYRVSETVDVVRSPSPKLIKDLIDNPTQKILDQVEIDENFAQMLNRLIEERGTKINDIKDALGYSDAAVFKLRKGQNNPAKLTVFALAIFFRLSLEETKDMLMKAGFAINPSSIQDVILSGLIRDGVYDRYTIDDTLYALDLVPLPGAVTD